eukprot:2382400-Prymnesium_polylepis.2
MPPNARRRTGASGRAQRSETAAPNAETALPALTGHVQGPREIFATECRRVQCHVRKGARSWVNSVSRAAGAACAVCAVFAVCLSDLSARVNHLRGKPRELVTRGAGGHAARMRGALSERDASNFREEGSESCPNHAEAPCGQAGCVVCGRVG